MPELQFSTSQNNFVTKKTYKKRDSLKDCPFYQMTICLLTAQ